MTIKESLLKLINRNSKPKIVFAPRQNIERYQADYKSGLTTEQALEHLNAGWNNEAMNYSAKSVKEIILSNTLTYFNMIFIILAVLIIIVGSFRNLTFMIVIVANTCIGIFQEIRAKNVLDKMNMLNAPHSRAVRDGSECVIQSDKLVVDDVVIFSAGNQICADATIIKGNVQVNEALLTGESDDISKGEGDRLLSGSFVVSGSCYARLTDVGRDSYISKLALEAKAMNNKEQSVMIASLNRLLFVVGIIIIPMAVLLVWQGLSVNGETFANSITSMVAAVIGMIPEGLYLLTSVALAVSTINLASKKVLLHDMKSIETLARVNVLCVDKTGTITENTMSVTDVVPEKNVNKTEFELAIGDFVNAMSDDNITMETLKKYFQKNNGIRAVGCTGFSSALKYSSVSFSDKVYVLGAPEMVLRTEYELHKDVIDKLSDEGGRVLCFAEYFGKIDNGPLVGRAVPMGYIVLANPVRENASKTFDYFAQQGVEIKVISGDNPLTVSRVSQMACIKDADKYVDASTLKSDEDIYDAVTKYTVFGRVTPEQKRKFVGALKQHGNTVAMVGDGVNDVLALKDADCSVAMASGSEAAAMAAQVVLLESDFSRMPSVVLEGRRVVNNIERSASLFLVKNIFSILLAICSIAVAMTYPLEPAQISFVTTFTIGMPGFLLALEPNKKRIEGHFMTNVLLKALPAGLTDFISVVAMVAFGNLFGIDASEVSTASTLLLAVVGVMILVKITRPLTKLGGTTIALCILGMVLSSLLIGDFFYLTSLSAECVALVIVFAVACESLFRYLSLIFEKISRNITKEKSDE